MKRVLSLVLLLMMVMGCACAKISPQAKQQVYDELGVCNVSAYDGKTWGDPYGVGTAKDYAVNEYIDTSNGLLTWDIEWENEDGERGYVFFEKWFPARGVIAELTYDMDSDGEDEWIVAYNQNIIETVKGYESESHCLILRIYEQSEDGLNMSDEIRIQENIDVSGQYACLFLTERDDESLLIFQGMSGIEGLLNSIWEISYRDGEFHADYGCMWESTDTSRLLICSESHTPEALYQWYDDAEAEWEYNFSENDQQVGYALFDQAIDSMGLSWENGQVNWNSTVCAENSTVLLKFDTWDVVSDNDRPIIRLQMAAPSRTVISTASVNLRAEPSLDGEIVAAVEAGENLPYLGEESTDDRGVVWYKVMHENQECWVSSKYAVLN